MANRIPLDPELPHHFYDTPSDKRSKHELDCWWDHPYGITQEDGSIAIYCLNGGDLSSPSRLGVTKDYDSACLLAQERQAKFLEKREKPVISEEPDGFLMIREEQRPDHEITVISEGKTPTEALDRMWENLKNADWTQSIIK
ncbi:hypothetical protein AB204_02320 [Xenorhabdus khoisanae]|uniref:Uncharacterized protein n=1 Tax=Xenorhabdus khoisanae TaxID=880157 RepID=A0A0J5FXJ7_9GAMM|nr:hypothetical protein [Xenorhabdus khoisanae]KMJ46677.1 hypothetical protein AB204_02320 [Xenorhabdus khoisanae]